MRNKGQPNILLQRRYAHRADSALTTGAGAAAVQQPRTELGSWKSYLINYKKNCILLCKVQHLQHPRADKWCCCAAPPVFSPSSFVTESNPTYSFLSTHRKQSDERLYSTIFKRGYKRFSKTLCHHTALQNIKKCLKKTIATKWILTITGEWQ